MEKNYKEHPFNTGDVVYHPIYGEGEVSLVDKPNKLVVVIFEKDCFGYYGENIKLLSFTPYEIPSNWERPYEPKDGDIVVTDEWVVIFRRLFGSNKLGYYAFLDTECNKITFQLSENHHVGYLDSSVRPAAEEEKQRLFDALEKEGWRWNDKKKQLEKIPVRPKEGDLAIAWNIGNHRNAIIGTYHLAACAKANVGDSYFNHCCKFESMEQYESIRRGEYD